MSTRQADADGRQPIHHPRQNSEPLRSFRSSRTGIAGLKAEEAAVRRIDHEAIVSLKSV
jgi:hypothetical protein